MSGARRYGFVLAAAGVLGACGGAASPAVRATPAPPVLTPHSASAPSADWPQFGFDAQRSNASDAPTGLNEGNLPSLRHRRIDLPGTVDSSPIYLHGVDVAGGARDVFVMTTSYGRTLAIDAANGATLWQYVPPGISGWEGSSRITNASPAADPSRTAVYAAAPDGAVRKLALSDGHALWATKLTQDPRHEKLTSALGISGSSLLVATGGYIGDAPPYQGHLAAVSRTSGQITALFNTLCANRRVLLKPSSCGASDSAIFSRGGAVVEPGTGRILLATGNGPYDGRVNFGDSVLELTPGNLRLRQAFTPVDQAQLNSSDTDLGSGGPVLLGGGLLASGGKDGKLRVLSLGHLNGRTAGRPFRRGGELQILPLPGSAEIFSNGAVGHGLLFLASSGGTRAYRIEANRLSVAWSNAAHGTSPVLAGGLLYVYDPDAGVLNIFSPANGGKLAGLPAGSGHWNSPVIADGRIALPEGNANDHARSGILDLFYVNG